MKENQELEKNNKISGQAGVQLGKDPFLQNSLIIIHGKTEGTLNDFYK
jgi:hypothetical protein